MTERFRKAVKGKESKQTLNGHIIHSACFFMAFFGHGVAEYLIAVSAACAFFSFLLTRCGSHSQHEKDQPSCDPRGLQRDGRRGELGDREQRSHQAGQSARGKIKWQLKGKTDFNWPIRVSNHGCMHVGKFTTSARQSFH